MTNHPHQHGLNHVSCFNASASTVFSQLIYSSMINTVDHFPHSEDQSRCCRLQGNTGFEANPILVNYSGITGDNVEDRLSQCIHYAKLATRLRLRMSTCDQSLHALENSAESNQVMAHLWQVLRFFRDWIGRTGAMSHAADGVEYHSRIRTLCLFDFDIILLTTVSQLA